MTITLTLLAALLALSWLLRAAWRWFIQRRAEFYAHVQALCEFHHPD